MRKAIAMKCNKEQFEAVKEKLNGIKFDDCLFDLREYPYLTNNYGTSKSEKLGSHSRDMIRKETEVHETWNEKVFLEACGIEPTFTITKETILKYEMKDEFPSVFKKELVVGKWYKYNGALCNYQGKQNRILRAYGIWNYKWNDISNCGSSIDEWTEATDQEVFEALKNESVKRYNDGEYVKRFNSSSLLRVDSEFKSELKDNDLWYGGGIVFRKGIWATIIPTITKKEAEEILGKKII